MPKVKVSKKLVGAIIAVMIFVQSGVSGLPIHDNAKTWVLFGAGMTLAGLYTVRSEETDPPTPTARVNDMNA